MIARLRVVPCLLLAILPLVAFAQPIPVRVLADSGEQQTVGINELVAEPFVARVVHAETGDPLSQVPVDFFVNLQTCIPMDPNCTPPPPAMYGQFQSAAITGLLTDAEGRVSAPAFRAGSVAGDYSIAAMLNASAAPPNDPSYVATPPDGTALFELRQIAGAAVAQPVPGPGAWALFLLVLAIVALAARTVARST